MDSETRTLITTLTAKIRDLRAGAQDKGEEGEELLKFVAEAGRFSNFNAFCYFLQGEAKGRPLSLLCFSNNSNNAHIRFDFVSVAENGLSSLSKAFQVAQNKGIHPRPSAEFESEEGGTIQYGSPAPRGNKK